MEDLALTEYLPRTVSSGVLWMIWGGALLIFLVAAVVYIYHWRRYGKDITFLRYMEILFLSVGVLLLAAAAVFVILLT